MYVKQQDPHDHHYPGQSVHTPLSTGLLVQLAGFDAVARLALDILSVVNEESPYKTPRST